MTPAEVWHPGHYLAEEMQARGWTAKDVAARMGGTTNKELGVDELVVMSICGDFLLPDDETCEMGPEGAAKLGRAFGVSPEFWLNLEKTWLENPNAIRHRY